MKDKIRKIIKETNRKFKTPKLEEVKDNEKILGVYINENLGQEVLRLEYNFILYSKALEKIQKLVK